MTRLIPTEAIEIVNESATQKRSIGVSDILIGVVIPGWWLRRVVSNWISWVAIAFFSLTWVGLLSFLVFGIVNPVGALGLLTQNSILVLMLVWLVLAITLTVLIAVFALRFGIKSTSRKQSILTFIALAVSVLQVLLLSWVFTTVNAQRELLNLMFTSTESKVSHTGASASSILDLVDGRVNVLLLGGDAGADRWGLRPDSISVVSVDASTGESLVIGVPRNLEQAPFRAGSPLYGPYPNGYDCGSQCLISYLFTYGTGHPELYSAPEYAGKNPGIEATRDAVEGVLGIRIPYTVLIDMAGFSKLVNAVGGITVCVPEDTLAQDMKTKFSAGCQHMNGDQALLYSRTRYDSNDYGRMKKQRLVQQALIEQIDPLKLMTNYQSVAKTGSQYVSTNIPRDQLPAFLELANKARKEPIKTLELVPPLVDVTNPDFGWIQSEIQARFAN